MGLEARCQVEWSGTRQQAAIHLDSQQLEVRFKPMLRVPFSAVRSLSVRAGRLELALAEGSLVLHLGAEEAARWAQKIRYPKSRLEKLGIRAGQRVCLLNFADAEFERELAAAEVQPVAKLARDADVVVLYVADRADLGRLGAVAKSIASNGAVWVLRAKGKGAPVSEEDVRAEAKRGGLVDIKVLAFSDALSGLKLVIPVSQRKTSAKRALKST